MIDITRQNKPYMSIAEIVKPKQHSSLHQKEKEKLKFFETPLRKSKMKNSALLTFEMTRLGYYTRGIDIVYRSRAWK
jgi:hypothetical protein